MQQLHENATMRFDDCRVARSIDKKSLDRVLMLNLRSLVAKSNFYKKITRAFFIYNKNVSQLKFSTLF